MFHMKMKSIEDHEKYEQEHSASEESEAQWYFSREEIENSPSRKDNIDLRREIYYQRSYSTFLQDLGMRLAHPQMIIATAITLCHRFFHRQSHSKNDRTTIAIACMFLSGKAEDNAVCVKEVLWRSYEILSRKDRELKKKNQEDYCQEQRQIVFDAEIVLLKTLGFDVVVYQPYRLLRTAIKEFGIADGPPLTQVAWNFVNDGLRTSMWLQFRPREMAAGAIFLAAKFMRVRLPLRWWTTFEVSPQRLAEVSDKLLVLYEEAKRYDRIASSRNQPGRLGEGTQIVGKDDKHAPKDAKGKSSVFVNQPKDDVAKISGGSAFNTLQISANCTESLAIQENRIQCGSRGDQIRSGIPFKLMEASDQKVSTSRPQVDELSLSSLQDRHVKKIDIDKPEALLEIKGGIQLSSNEQLPSVDISCVNAEKIAQLKRRKRREGKNLKTYISETEARDVEALIEFELERGVEEAAKADKAKQERNMYRSESCYIPGKESAQDSKECAGKDGSRLNRKRSNEDISIKDTSSDKMRKCSTNEVVLCHQGQEMLPADDPHDELEEGEIPMEEGEIPMEEGEIPNSPVEELTKPSNEGPSQVSNQPETGKDSIKGGDYCVPEASKNKDDSERLRDHHGIRHGSYDRRVSRSHHHFHHSTDHQGRGSGRERRRSRDRNWEEQRDRGRDWRRPTDRNWEENIYKRRRRDD